MKKKLHIVGSVGIPARYGGFETLTEELCNALCSDYEIVVTCSSRAYSSTERTKKWKSVSRRFLPINANGVSSIFYDTLSMFIAGAKSDILLILGASGTIALPLIRILFPNTKIVFHPDGAEWNRQKWNFISRLFLKLSAIIGSIFSHGIVLDNKELEKYYSRCKNKLHFISYGGDHIPILRNESENYWLTIARAEMENNLEMIAHSFKTLKNENWIVLTNYKNTRFGRKFYEKYRDYSYITIKDALYDKLVIGQLLSNCKGYIHGHSAGGTNPSLITAMWSKKVLFCHDNLYNRESTNNLVSYFSSSGDLQKLILTLKKSSVERRIAMLCQDKYSWKTIAYQYNELFKSITN